jgi:hypothetical protein
MESHGAPRHFTLIFQLCFAMALLGLSHCQTTEAKHLTDAGLGAQDSGANDGQAQIDANMGPDAPPMLGCDLWTNDGCPAGRHCALYFAGGERFEADCVPDRPNEAQAGEPCTVYDNDSYSYSDNCASGSWCVGGTPEAATCMQLCRTDAPELCDGAYQDQDGAPIDGVCIIDLFTAEGPDLRGCLRPEACNAVCQDCPSSNQLCVPVTDRHGQSTALCMPRARDYPDGFHDDGCGAINTCQPGFACVEGRCRAICRLATAPALDGGPRDGGGNDGPPPCFPPPPCSHRSLPDGSSCAEHNASWTSQGYGLCSAR